MGGRLDSDDTHTDSRYTGRGVVTAVPDLIGRVAESVTTAYESLTGPAWIHGWVTNRGMISNSARRAARSARHRWDRPQRRTTDIILVDSHQRRPARSSAHNSDYVSVYSAYCIR